MAPAKLYFIFDEILVGGHEVDYKRLACVNAIGYELEPGTYELESFEPYTLRYAKILVFSGFITYRKIYIRELANPDTGKAAFASDRESLNKIFTAAVETFNQNATDIFMDCPSRERAGWLCDSFFTARVEALLTGRSAIETNFLENYALPERFAHLPEGMLPMCYPGDHQNGVYIPNWALWLVIELQEYVQRTGDTVLVERLRQKVYALFAYFERYTNEDGLLEKLDSWVFVEWSHANNVVQDVNYPTNMLFAAALRIAGELYGDGELATRAEQVKETIRQQSYNGEYFVDNAVRVEGELRPTGVITEVCQYYAFTSNIAAPDTHPELWDRLVADFGPDRKQTNKHSDVHFANAFMGNYPRLDLMSRYGNTTNTIQELEGYFLGMAQLTGTLSTEASCNHGFASHVVYWRYKDALGIRQVDHRQKTITVVLWDNGLQVCEGTIPAGDGTFSLKWWREGERWHYMTAGDHGYAVQVEAGTGVPVLVKADSVK